MECSRPHQGCGDSPRHEGKLNQGDFPSSVFAESKGQNEQRTQGGDQHRVHCDGQVLRVLHTLC